MHLDLSTFPLVWMRREAEPVQPDSLFAQFDALLARRQAFVILSEEGFDEDGHEHPQEERKRAALWMKRNKAAIRAYIQAMVLVEPSAAKRLAGKAFHSIYFEVLGEQGIPGFVMYLAMSIITLRKLSRLKKQWRDHMGMTWLSALADALINSITVFLVGGSFVGIAYQPYIFYMIGLTVAIDQYSARVEKELRLKKLRERQLEENAAFEFYQNHRNLKIFN